MPTPLSLYHAAIYPRRPAEGGSGATRCKSELAAQALALWLLKVLLRIALKRSILPGSTYTQMSDKTLCYRCKDKEVA